MTARITRVGSTGSTNDDLMALARAGAPEGSWLLADVQTGGRGRHGRPWQSLPGNFYASTLVRLRPGDPPPPTLAFVAAVALDELVAAHVGAARVMLKWPNDLLAADGAKLAGILLERGEDAVVVGFGVNLASTPQGLDRLATSFTALDCTAPDPADFAEELAAACARWLARWRGEGLGVVTRRWAERAHPPGTLLRAQSADGAVVDGLFDGLDADGALRLRLADGGVHVMHAGDVFLIRD